MNCESFELKVADLVAGRTDPDTAAELASHRAACSACRDFEARVAGLYDLEAALPAHPPAALGFPLEASPEKPRRVAGLLVVAVAATAALVAAVWWSIQGGGEAPPKTTELATGPTDEDPLPIELEEIRLDMPQFPALLPEVGQWIDSREEAELVSEFTGRPLIQQFVLRGCVFCKGTQALLESPEYRDRLFEFVLYRETIVEPDVLPDEIAERSDDPMLPYSFPAMTVQASGCNVQPRWSIRSWEDVEEVLADYYAFCVRDQEDDRLPLDDTQYERVRGALGSLPDLVGTGGYLKAMEILGETIALADGFRTRFVDEARELEAQLLDGLDRQAARIEELYDGNEAERTRATELANELRARAAGLPVAERLLRICAYGE